MNLRKSWRTVAMGLVGVSLLTVASISFASAQSKTSGNRAASPVTVASRSGTGNVKFGGVVDLSKLPTLKSGAQNDTRALPARDRLTPAERDAYRAAQKAHPTVAATGPIAQAPRTSTGPSFVGGGVNPLFVRGADGLSSAQACNCIPPDQALATDLSYVMEGTNNAFAIYRASTGALQFGPFSAASFFAPLFHAGDFYSDPQMNYDVMHDRWIITWLEVDASETFDYIDIAISQTNSPTPGGGYFLYQTLANYENSGATPSLCDYQTMGVDYWTLDLTCVNFRGGFVGNTLAILPKAPLLAGSGTGYTFFNDALKTSGGAHPAFRLSPAIEEGVQDAEFFVSTDAGWGTSQNMGICAATNLSNVTTTTPTVTCQNINLGANYADPFGGRQPGTASLIDPGLGVKQVYYKSGRLFLSQASAVNGTNDAAYYAEVQPQLTTKAAHNPQWINGAIVTEVGFVNFGANYDIYMPTLMGTDEDDLLLVANYSSSAATVYPSIFYTGRKATDAPNTMGQGFTNLVVAGTHFNDSGRWGDYSACAVTLNSVTRGGIWCAGEYAGPLATPNWNTRIYNIRTE
jgi:hypothetical protein